MNNNQNNPQDNVPKVENIKEKTKNAIIENQIDITGWNVSPSLLIMIKACMEEYSDNFQSRIAELEKQNNELKHIVEYSDGLRIESENKNAEYKKALKCVLESYNDGSIYLSIPRIEFLLNNQ